MSPGRHTESTSPNVFSLNAIAAAKGIFSIIVPWFGRRWAPARYREQLRVEFCRSR